MSVRLAAGASAPATPSLAVLIVQADTVTAAAAAHALAAAGLRPLPPVVDAAQALAAVETHAPDLAFVEVDLACGRSGPSLATALAARGVAVVFATAEPDAIPADWCGAVGLVPKPCGPEALVRAAEVVARVRGGADPRPWPRGFVAAPTLVRKAGAWAVVELVGGRLADAGAE